MANTRRFSSELVVQAQEGDPAARDRLLTDLQPVLRAFFIKRIGLKPEVDDLIQNTLLRVHRGLEDLKDTERLKAFTMKAALFELNDLYRGRYGTKESVYDPDYLPEETAREDRGGHRVDLERALSTLTPKARRIIELREYGYRYEEIAQTIGSTEAAVKMQVKRAFEKMRTTLAAGFALLLLGKDLFF